MVRLYRPKDFKWLDEWSVFHEGERMVPSMVPQVGFVSEDELGPAAYWGVCRTDTIYCMGIFLVTRPNLERDKRKEHVKNVIQAVTDWASKQKLALFCLSDKASVKSHLEASGFKLHSDGLSWFHFGG